MTWTSRNVWVTGAGGFIGSHLAERLVALGADVRAFVHYNALGLPGWLHHSPLRNEMRIIAGDVRDRDTLAEAAKGAEVVIHLAALIGIPYSFHAPDSYVQTNIAGTLNVLSAAQAAGVERFVHTSTSEVYGTARHIPIDENHPLQCQSPYAASKCGADKLAESFHCAHGLPVVTVRPFNTFGPRQSARAVIPTVIAACLAGTGIQLGNLEPSRDFNYIEDTVEGFIKAAASPDAVGRTINIGSGCEVRVGDVVQRIAQLTGRPIDVETDARRVRPEQSEVMRLVADNTLAKKLLGWSPRVPLEEGLRRTIAWMREHQRLYRADTYAV